MNREFARAPGPMVRYSMVGEEVAIRCDIPGRESYHICTIVKWSDGDPLMGNGPVAVVKLNSDEVCENFFNTQRWRSWNQLYSAKDVREARAAIAGAASRAQAMDPASPASGSDPSVQGALVEHSEDLRDGDVLDAIDWETPYVFGTNRHADAAIRYLVRQGAVVLRVYRRG